MKKFLLVLLLALMVSTVHCQYRTYKNLYDVKEYKYQKTDRYDLAGPIFVSFIVPGLGHVLIGEPLRGLGFYALNVGSLGIAMAGLSQMNENSNQTLGNVLAISGAGLFVGSYIWCISDVGRVAKIKNMAFRDKKLAIHLYPSLQTCSNGNTLGASLPGATLNINF